MEATTLLSGYLAARNASEKFFVGEPDLQLLDIGNLVGERDDPEFTQRFYDKTVLLCLPGQSHTAMALLLLDGLASCIILSPAELNETQQAAICTAEEVDVVVRHWPLLAPGNCFSNPPHPPQASIGWPEITTSWILFTSGTSGKPKLAVHTLSTLAGHLDHPLAAIPPPVWCSFYDIRRYGGLQVLLRSMMWGRALLLSVPTETTSDMLRRAASVGATHFVGTPTHWRKVLMSQACALINPVYIRLSGEIADQIVLDRLSAQYPAARIVHAFASTEVGLVFEVADGLAGFSPHKLVDDLGDIHIRVENGTLRVKSPRVAQGYRNGKMTSAVSEENGFVDTGDIVELRDARYYFAGRKDGRMNVGGKKISPEDIEAVINQHGRVHMSLVKTRPSPITGTLIVAEIVCSGASFISQTDDEMDRLRLEREIIALCRSQLEPHQVPAFVRAVKALNISPSGKLVRHHA
jgi:acyl-coenzyme A synthetase/AMP-(fatty) acid ligase